MIINTIELGRTAHKNTHTQYELKHASVKADHAQGQKRLPASFASHQQQTKQQQKKKQEERKREKKKNSINNRE